MRMLLGGVVPLVVGVCLPLLTRETSAAERLVTVPDAGGAWTMTIAPAGRERAAAQPSAVRVAMNDEIDGPIVPLPIENEPAGRDATEPQAASESEVPSSEPAIPCGPMTFDRNTYWAAYQAVPFIRTEYQANPSYRHEAAMELLFGQLRPTVIHKTQETGFAQAPPPQRPFPPYIFNPVLGGQIPSFVFNYGPRTVPLPFTRSLGR